MAGRRRSTITRKNRNSTRRWKRAAKSAGKIKFSKPYRPAVGSRIRFHRWKSPKGNWCSSKTRF